MKTYNVKSGATIEERLAFYTYVDYDTGCHVWVGSKTEKGYGQIGDGYKVRRTHRVAYELVHGPIPKGVKLDHICRVRACCNPLHLRPSTSRRNTIVGASCLLKPGKTSQYLGVWRDGDKWGVKIHCGGTRRHLGRFTDEHTAGQVYQNIFNTIEWLEEHSDREIKPEALAEILGDGDWGTQPPKESLMA